MILVMSMYSLYFTVGFSPDFIISRLLTHGVKDVSRVLLIRVRTGLPGDRRSEYASILVRQALNLQVPVYEIVVDPTDASSAMYIIAERMVDDVLSNRRLIVNVSGGPRILVLETLITAMIIKAMMPSASIRVEIMPEYSIDEGSLLDLTSIVEVLARGLEHVISKIKRGRLAEVLVILSERNEITIQDLAGRLSVKEGTAGNYIYELVRYGLVEPCGHRGIYRLTPIGKVLALLLKKLSCRT